jgi:hypothetical protein
MTVKTTTAPKAKATAAPASGHGCCGGDVAPEPQTKTAKPADSAALGHATPSKAAETCCCGDAGTK